MKLRIRGNSIRLRLTRSEVDVLAEKGLVEEATAFGGARLTYALRTTTTTSALSASLLGTRIEVLVNADRARAWAKSDEVGLEAEQDVGESTPLRLLVEKDFACLTERPGEPNDDTFPNPNDTC
jgi:hypothetical protein